MGCTNSKPAADADTNNQTPQNVTPVTAINHNQSTYINTTDSPQKNKNETPASPINSPRVPGDSDFYKAIHSAIRWNKIEQVEELLNAHAEAATALDERNGNQPVHIAAQNGHIDIVRMLHKKNANVNAVNKKGNTPLHMAIGYDFIECAEFLISVGADGTIKNESGHLARNGIDGDKSILTTTLYLSKTTPELLQALRKCGDNKSNLEKGSFAATGLKTKKAAGTQWTPEVQQAFAAIVSSL